GSSDQGPALRGGCWDHHVVPHPVAWASLCWSASCCEMLAAACAALSVLDRAGCRRAVANGRAPRMGADHRRSGAGAARPESPVGDTTATLEWGLPEWKAELCSPVCVRAGGAGFPRPVDCLGSLDVRVVRSVRSSRPASFPGS